MLKALLAILVVQDAELEEALKRDCERIAARRPLEEVERRRYVEASSLLRSSGSRPKTSIRLVVIPLGFADAVCGTSDLEARMGRLADYYGTLSSKAFQLEWTKRASVRVPMSQAAFGALPTGSDVEKELLVGIVGPLEQVDAVIFVAAGAVGERGTARWPHKDELLVQGRALGYVILPEQVDLHGAGIWAHEFGHLLGLEDKYEDKAANVGWWCLMGTGYLGDKNGDPMPLCVVCREELGWAVIGEASPEVVQKLSLGRGESVRIAMGKEALVLEMREELLVWHTGGGKAIELLATFPAPARDRLTPYSNPPLLGRTMGARPLWLTDVRIEGGRAYLYVGLSGEPTPLEELRRARVGKPLGE